MRRLKFSSKRNVLTCALLTAAWGLTACQPATESASSAASAAAPVTGSALWPNVHPQGLHNDSVEQRVTAILSSMTVEQKVAQMIQPEIRDITVDDMRRYGFGSYLNGGGAFPNDNKHASAQDWIALAEAMYQASMDSSVDGIAIPTMWGTDAVHGHNNVIGATLFPHNIALGATHNPALIEQVAAATAREVMATGIDWVFAPTVAVGRDDRWGRTYESYSEDPELVKAYAAAIVTGLQGKIGADFLSDQHVISTVKHFLGDGGTQGGDDQGNNIASEAELFRLHAQGYVAGLGVGAQTVMASFNSWQGNKIHGSQYLLTDVLKGKMGFDGLVVGDWNGHGQIPGCSNDNCPAAVNAGVDILMVPTQAWRGLLANTIAQVRSGEISEQRLDDAVRRILRVKMRAGLFDKPSPAQRPLAGKTELIGAAAHRAVARAAVQQSLVLLKNQQQLLPLNPKSSILVAGDGADNIGMQSGGWTITWQGTGNQNSDFPGGSSIYAGLAKQVQAAGGQIQLSVDGHYQQKPDVAVVVFGEQPYAEGNGDLDNLEFERGNKRSLALLQRLRAEGIKVVSVFLSGRPLWVNPELNASDAFVAAWLPGSEGEGIADVLLSKADGTVNVPFTGKLSFSWPATPDQHVNRGQDGALFAYGYGLSNGQVDPLTAPLPEHLSDAQAIADKPIFDRDLKAPWQWQLQSGARTASVTSSLTKHGAVTMQSVDVHVQEDARLLRFDGSEQAMIRAFSAFPEDLRGYEAAGGALAITLRLDEPAGVAPLYLQMTCGDQCYGQYDIQPQLVQAQAGQWYQLQVPLRCFNSGATPMALGNVFSPFGLTTAGQWQFTVQQVALVADTNQPQCLAQLIKQ